MTWKDRALPDFIIIGAQRSGTTSLYSYLSQHPQLLPSSIKEVHYFDGGMYPGIDHYKRGESWYRAHFPLKKDIGTNQKTFEASPLYLFNPLAASRIYDLVPKVNIIAVLRNPTERAISQYFFSKRLNKEHLPIFEALQAEERRLERIIKNKEFKSDAFMYHSYKSRGLYKQQLERYLKYFHRNQIRILSSEKLFSDPENTLRQVYEFVGVDVAFTPDNLKPHNVSDNKSGVSSEVYDYLNTYFRPHNQELYNLIGDEFGW